MYCMQAVIATQSVLRELADSTTQACITVTDGPAAPPVHSPALTQDQNRYRTAPDHTQASACTDLR
jgi:hypothetical protein